MDICKEQPKDEFDLVLCHLLLGETIKFGNTLENMLNGIFNINTKQICIIDYLEDIDIDFDFVKKAASEKGYMLVKEEVFPKENPEKYSTFIGENYIGLLFKKED